MRKIIKRKVLCLNRLLLFLFLLFILSACSESETKEVLHDPIIVGENRPLEPVKHSDDIKVRNWMWMLGENDSESLDQLVDMDEPSGNRYVRLDDIIKSLHEKEHGDYPWYELDVGGITPDGSRIALIRESHDLNHDVIKVFELSTSKKKYEFNIPNNKYFFMSSDLSTYVFENDDGLYQYNIKNQIKKKLDITKADLDDQKSYGHMLSPDGTKIALGGAHQKLIIFNLLNNKIEKKLAMGSNDFTVRQWLEDDRLLYTFGEQEQLHVLNVITEQTALFEKMSPNETTLPISTQDGQNISFKDVTGEIWQRNLKNNDEIKYSGVMNRIGYSLQPVQWLQTTTDLMKFKKSVSVRKISASSTLSAQAGNTYDAANLVDGNPNTAWSEGVAGDGIGESIMIDFGSVQRLNGIELLNGLVKSNKLYKQNNKIKKMKLEFSDGQSLTLDSYFLKNNFEKPIQSSSMKITILEVERGTKYRDTCISELRVF
ncbi:discoidin domain-containing protein [Paenibacillus glacialis]|uniref:F5/8 type C domain-containing protein n=1 Tax=Paenibacillus glacialis TaxID=494026 RepID=A0A168K8G0_9BACL|nr:discoidin domain-containing protein [Paenibacillus glacialis]OAB41695.1 hypothetical protein PGLA_15590 [Paenibacillus glacialis]